MEKALKVAKGSWWQSIYIIEGSTDVWNIIKQEAPGDSQLQLCDCSMSRLVVPSHRGKS